MLEKQYHDELKKEMSGTTYSSSLSNKNSENTDSDEMQHQDEDMVPVSTEKDDEDNRAKLYMSRKKKGLFEAMEVFFSFTFTRLPYVIRALFNLKNNEVVVQG